MQLVAAPSHPHTCASHLHCPIAHLARGGAALHSRRHSDSCHLHQGQTAAAGALSCHHHMSLQRPHLPHPPQISSSAPAAHRGGHGDQVWGQRGPALHLHPLHPRWVPSSRAAWCPGQPLDLSRQTASLTHQSSLHRWPVVLTAAAGQQRHTTATRPARPPAGRRPCAAPCTGAHWQASRRFLAPTDSTPFPCYATLAGHILTSAAICCGPRGQAHPRWVCCASREPRRARSVATALLQKCGNKHRWERASRDRSAVGWCWLVMGMGGVGCVGGVAGYGWAGGAGKLARGSRPGTG